MSDSKEEEEETRGHRLGDSDNNNNNNNNSDFTLEIEERGENENKMRNTGSISGISGISPMMRVFLVVSVTMGTIGGFSIALATKYPTILNAANIFSFTIHKGSEPIECSTEKAINIIKDITQCPIYKVGFGVSPSCEVDILGELCITGDMVVNGNVNGVNITEFIENCNSRVSPECWDLNNNYEEDDDEDVNQDGVWNITDCIQIGQLACRDVECDGNACEVVTCIYGACIVTGYNQMCCLTDGECNDGNPCTEDICNSVTHTCTHSLYGCSRDAECTVDQLCMNCTCSSNIPLQVCVISADCNDNITCTFDICDPNNRCANIPIPRCCEVDDDCLIIGDIESSANTCNTTTGLCVVGDPDEDEDGVPRSIDCDDTDPDNTDTKDTYYRDQDGDDVGSSSSTVLSCESVEGYTLDGGDCDDLNMCIYPGQKEFCNSLDDDCDGNVDEGDAINCLSVTDDLNFLVFTGSGTRAGSGFSSAIVDGNPAVLIGATSDSNCGIFYMRSSTSTGAETIDWDDHYAEAVRDCVAGYISVTEGASRKQPVSLIDVGGSPGIFAVWGTGTVPTSDLVYYWTADADTHGSSMVDDDEWVASTIESSTEIIDVIGRTFNSTTPTVVYGKVASPTSHLIIYAVNNRANGTGTWTKVTVGSFTAPSSTVRSLAYATALNGRGVIVASTKEATEYKIRLWLQDTDSTWDAIGIIYNSGTTEINGKIGISMTPSGKQVISFARKPSTVNTLNAIVSDGSDLSVASWTLQPIDESGAYRINTRIGTVANATFITYTHQASNAEKPRVRVAYNCEEDPDPNGWTFETVSSLSFAQIDPNTAPGLLDIGDQLYVPYAAIWNKQSFMISP